MKVLPRLALLAELPRATGLSVSATHNRNDHRRTSTHTHSRKRAHRQTQAHAQTCIHSYKLTLVQTHTRTHADVLIGEKGTLDNCDADDNCCALAIKINKLYVVTKEMDVTTEINQAHRGAKSNDNALALDGLFASCLSVCLSACLFVAV